MLSAEFQSPRRQTVVESATCTCQFDTSSLQLRRGCQIQRFPVIKESEWHWKLTNQSGNHHKKKKKSSNGAVIFKYFYVTFQDFFPPTAGVQKKKAVTVKILLKCSWNKEALNLVCRWSCCYFLCVLCNPRCDCLFVEHYWSMCWWTPPCYYTDIAHHQVHFHHGEAFSQSRVYCTKICGAKLRCTSWCNFSFNWSWVDLHFFFFFNLKVWTSLTDCSI